MAVLLVTGEKALAPLPTKVLSTASANPPANTPMVAGPEYGAILSLAFGVTRRDAARVARSAAALAIGSTLAALAALLLSLVVRWAGLAPAAYPLGVPGLQPEALNVSVLTAVATLGLPAQQALWQRAIRRSATAPPD